jgi:F0F1-type ATP synthase membrane subunit c/vacuolar-type H+-ATPase subunit K
MPVSTGPLIGYSNVSTGGAQAVITNAGAGTVVVNPTVAQMNTAVAAPPSPPNNIPY